MSTFARTRRSFFTSTVAGSIPALASSSTSNSRALVCIFLIGGNDSNNMIVPLEPGPWREYARGRGSLALNRRALLPVRSERQNGLFGFHPALGNLASLYTSGQLAVVANTGRPQSSPADPLPHTAAGNATFLPPGLLTVPWLRPRQVLAFGGVTLVLPSPLSPAAGPILSTAPLRTAFPQSTIGQQLLRAARILKQRVASRPVITCAMPGWDTHSHSLLRQERLFAELGAAMAAFFRATEELGIADDVVTYTSTEFNRRLTPNSNGGAEHAWGGHELVMGASVRGGEIYGKFPSLAVGGADDAANNGAWIPAAPASHVDAELARWHGLNEMQFQRSISPFHTGPQTSLGFLG